MTGTIKVSTRKTAALAAMAAAVAVATPLVAGFEGKRNDPYRDIVGVWTDCYGHTGPDVKPGQRKTDAQCLAQLNQDIEKHAAPIVACVPEIEHKPYQLAASISLAFNIGARAFCGSSVAREFRAGRDAQACAAFDRWAYAGGRRVAGLVRRRAAERALCERGL